MLAALASGGRSGHKSKKKHHKSSKDKSSKDKSSRDDKHKSSKEKGDKHSSSKDEGKSTSYIGLYSVIYQPHYGNYHHWAFAAYLQNVETWYIFQVVQDVQDGPFRSEVLQTDPRNSARCLQPLLGLGYIDSGWWSILVEQISEIHTAQREAAWNCQDYVIEIWQRVRASGMVDEDTFRQGYAEMQTRYGPMVDEDDEQYEESSDEEEEGRYYPSEEFVYDSDE